MDLGKWAVIDIETTGIDAVYDNIIDVGFFQFEGTKLVRQFSSLVRSEQPVGHFIQKLTGINNKMLKNAPLWENVEQEVQELYGHALVAHNADFERSFLEESFRSIDDGSEKESYEDSLFYLGLLFPEMSSLNLEGFITHFGIADKEEHRGLQDSLDLLKVMLVATAYRQKDHHFYHTLMSLFSQNRLNDWWFYRFFSLSHEELCEIASQIDFDLKTSLALYEKQKNQNEFEEYEYTQDFSLEFQGETIRDIFRNEKKIQEKAPQYQYREAQEKLAMRVGQSFKNDVHALIQAPTGTGKTLGYLVPAALFSREEEKQVLIATGTKALQNQAMTKDIPQLRKILGLAPDELKVSQLVGSQNHLCELLFRQKNNDGDLLKEAENFEQRFTQIYLEMVFYHNSKAKSSEQILRVDLPFVLKKKLKELALMQEEIAVDFRSCSGQKCPFKGQCSYINGLRQAKDANIIIGNHALMFSWPKGIPRPSHIIVDEAHRIEHEATKAFSHEITEKELEQLSKNLLHLQGIGSLFYLLAQTEQKSGESSSTISDLRQKTLEVQQMLNDHLLPLHDLVECYFKKMPRFSGEFWNELPMISEKQTTDELGRSLFNHLDSIRHIIANYNEALLPHAARFELNNTKDENQIMAITRFQTFFDTLIDLQEALEYNLNKPQKREGVSRSLRFHNDYGYELLSAPIDIGKVLHDGLLAGSSSVVFTSATLANAKGDQGGKGIEWATGHSYLEPTRRFKTGLYLPASYDYQNKTRVYLCDDTPPLYDSTFVQTALTPVMSLIRELGGRSLLLFSAKKRFEIACELLLKEFEGEIPVFIQGMGNNVIEEFRQSGEGILLGMESFGEGIDIPGEALQFVFIDKIPDLRMDQVVQDRRHFYESSLGNEFTDYYLAHRTRALHQKLGRLLRTDSDIGGIIVVDSRIRNWKGRTMEKLMKLMEPYRIERSNLENACHGVKEFIENHNNL